MELATEVEIQSLPAQGILPSQPNFLGLFELGSRISGHPATAENHLFLYSFLTLQSRLLYHADELYSRTNDRKECLSNKNKNKNKNIYYPLPMIQQYNTHLTFNTESARLKLRYQHTFHTIQTGVMVT